MKIILSSWTIRNRWQAVFCSWLYCTLRSVSGFGVSQQEHSCKVVLKFVTSISQVNLQNTYSTVKKYPTNELAFYCYVTNSHKILVYNNILLLFHSLVGQMSIMVQLDFLLSNSQGQNQGFGHTGSYADSLGKNLLLSSFSLGESSSLLMYE